MIDIRELYRAANGTKETITFDAEKDELEIPNLIEPVEGEFSLLRVQEGISLNIISLKALLSEKCVLCQKEVQVPVTVSEGEWLFFDQRPKDYDDENEFLFIDKDEYEIDPMEPIRQEIYLHLSDSPRCDVQCATFDQESKGVKALANLKDMFKESDTK